MKNCPTCGSSYTDDTLVFCLQDGTALQSGAATNPLSLIATLRGDSQQTEEMTKEMTASSAPTAQIPASAMPTAVYEAPRPTSDHASHPAQTPPSTARTVIITSVVTILLVAIGGISAWLFLRGAGDGREQRAQQSDSTNPANSNTGVATNPSNEAQPKDQARTGDGSGDKGGRWFVVLASFPKADTERMNERMMALRSQGIDARVVSSDDYPNFKPGLWVILMGPFTRNNAEEVLEQVRPKVKDAYTKSGW